MNKLLHKKRHTIFKNKKRTLKGGINTRRKTRKIKGGDESLLEKTCRPRRTTHTLPTHTIDGKRNVSDDKIRDFARNVVGNKGPQVIVLPVPPESHAFLVNITNENIMVSNWSGELAEIRASKSVMINDRLYRNTPSRYYKKKWTMFSKFLNFLRERFPEKELLYYDVDTDLSDEANEHHINSGNSGGCSYYIYKWIDKHWDEIKPE